MEALADMTTTTANTARQLYAELVRAQERKVNPNDHVSLVNFTDGNGASIQGSVMIHGSGAVGVNIHIKENYHLALGQNDGAGEQWGTDRERRKWKRDVRDQARKKVLQLVDELFDTGWVVDHFRAFWYDAEDELQSVNMPAPVPKGEKVDRYTVEFKRPRRLAGAGFDHLVLQNVTLFFNPSLWR